MAKPIEKKTFCQLSPQMTRAELDTYTKLASDPRFICRKCCRLSSKKKNLCQPKKLKGK